MKQIPGYPKVLRFRRGHFYLLENQGFVGEFRGILRDRYVFTRLASNPHPASRAFWQPIKSLYTVFTPKRIADDAVREVSLQELMLFVSWRTTPTFIRLISGKQRRRPKIKASYHLWPNQAKRHKKIPVQVNKPI